MSSAPFIGELVACEQCTRFVPNERNPEAAIGRCRRKYVIKGVRIEAWQLSKGQEGATPHPPYPMALRQCSQFDRAWCPWPRGQA